MGATVHATWRTGRLAIGAIKRAPTLRPAVNGGSHLINVPQEYSLHRMDVFLRFAFDLPFKRADLLARVVERGFHQPPPSEDGTEDEVPEEIVAQNKDENAFIMMDVKGKRTIGILAMDRVSALHAFDELLGAVQEGLGIALDSSLDRAECTFHATVVTGTRPREAVHRGFEDAKKCSAFSELFGEDLSVCTIELVPKHKNPNDSNWVELSIGPAPGNPAHYRVDGMARNPDAAAIRAFIEHSEMKVLKAISIVEEK